VSEKTFPGSVPPPSPPPVAPPTPGQQVQIRDNQNSKIIVARAPSRRRANRHCRSPTSRRANSTPGVGGAERARRKGSDGFRSDRAAHRGRASAGPRRRPSLIRQTRCRDQGVVGGLAGRGALPGQDAGTSGDHARLGKAGFPDIAEMPDEPGRCYPLDVAAEISSWNKPGLVAQQLVAYAEQLKFSGSFLVVIADEHGWPEDVSGAPRAFPPAAGYLPGPGRTPAGEGGRCEEQQGDHGNPWDGWWSCVASRHTVAIGVTGEPVAPGRRRGGAVSSSRDRPAARRCAANSDSHHNSPRWTPSSNRQRR